MATDVQGLIGACKRERADQRTTSPNGYRERARDTRLNTLNLMAPNLRQGIISTEQMKSGRCASLPSMAMCRSVPTERRLSNIRAMGWKPRLADLVWSVRMVPKGSKIRAGLPRSASSRTIIFMTFFVTACVSTASQVERDDLGSMTAEEAALYEQLQFFVDAGEIRSTQQRLFFAKEAAEAGVTAIRPMTVSEKPRRLIGAQTGCGRTKGRQILVDADRRMCVFMGNLAHEIAHFTAYRESCYGHGDRFYRLNYQLAKRFEARFPGTAWGRFRPTTNVLNRAKIYRNGERGCPGAVDIRGL